jgi:homoserine dehydrogenase
MINDAWKVINDPQVDIVIEMIGGQGIAKELILAAIGHGKQVITANKALLAMQGKMLFDAARARGVDLAYEASVGGCMPVIKTLRESLVGNRIRGMTGILNGTCNYILSKISAERLPFETVLADAQAKGYAEADPTLDIEGLDTAHKLAIISALAYGTEVNLKDIFIEGINRISPMDIELAETFGYRIKLLAISKNLGKAIEARVHPTMIPFDNLLSNVNGTLNAIAITGDAVGTLVLNGHGAGMMPTGSAVISDLVDQARNLICNAGPRVPALSYQADKTARIPVLPISAITTRYYFRFAAMDRPGVLSKISGILGNHGISLKSVHQKGRSRVAGAVPIVMLTHLAKEEDVRLAVGEIMDLDVVSDRPVLIRIEDENETD